MTMIQVRMKDATLNQVDSLKERVNAPSRSDAIRRAVEISEFITKAAQQGGHIIVESKDGKKTRILIPGVIEE